MCKGMMCLQIPFHYGAICHIGVMQTVIWLWTHWRRQLILRMNSGQTFLNAFEVLSVISVVCDDVVFLWRLDLAMNVSLANRNLTIGSIGFLYLAIKNGSKGAYSIFLLLQLVFSVIKINRYRLLYSLHQNLCGCDITMCLVTGETFFSPFVSK